MRFRRQLLSRVIVLLISLTSSVTPSVFVLAFVDFPYIVLHMMYLGQCFAIFSSFIGKALRNRSALRVSRKSFSKKSIRCYTSKRVKMHLEYFM
jgi:hypothetical protein